MQSEPEQPVLPEPLRDFIDRYGHFLAAACGIDPNDALTDSFGDPQLSVRPVGDFPGIVEIACDNACLESFRRLGSDCAGIYAGPRRYLRVTGHKTEKRGNTDRRDQSSRDERFLH
jgi:hypothetical protein